MESSLYTTCMFHSGIFLVPFAQLLLLVLLFGSFEGSFLFRNVLYFFFFLTSLLASSLSYSLVVLVFCLQWHTVGAKIKVPYVENREL